MIEPYYQDESGQVIYCGDCREILPQLGSFDLLLTDPCYGIDAGNMNLGGYRSSNIKSGDWDATPTDTSDIFKAIQRADKSIIWGGNYFDLPPTRQFLIWDKTVEIQGRSFAECEYAWCSWDGVSRIFRFSPTTMKKVHKTQKPECLFRWCLNQVPQGSSVLDCWAGVGTTAVAAKREGWKSVSIEINEKYCEDTAKRLEQKVMFGPEVEPITENQKALFASQ